MRLKVCGMTLPQQVIALEEIDIDLAGFIFYPGSPRYMGHKISAAEMRKIRGKIIKVGVFVNARYEELMRIVEDYRLDMVQLHGDETPRFCEQVSNYITVIKAFRLSENDPIEWMLKPYEDSCEMYMFDTIGAGYGGTGKKFNWSQLETLRPDKPFFLSGGIEAGDEPGLLSFNKNESAQKLFAVDVNSRFEVGAGIKDMSKLKTFVRNLKGGAAAEDR